MSEVAQRIAALTPRQREALLRGLAKARPPGREPAPPLPQIVPRPEDRFEPFPLTDVQQVYWAGRSGFFDLPTPGPGATVYVEYDFPGDESFVPAFERAFQSLFDRHEMLRAVMLPDGRQQYLRDLPPWRVEREDLRWRPAAEVEARMAAARERFRYQPGRVGQWPLFGFLVHFLDGGRVRLYAWFDAWLMDGLSRDNLVRDLMRLLADPDAGLPPLECSYRDYAMAWDELRGTDFYRRCRDYWHGRIPSLPPPPELPLAEVPRPETPVRFTPHLLEVLPPEGWTRLKAAAARRGLTPTTPLLAAFTEVLRAWSRSPRFTFGLDSTYWPPIHPQLRDILGNFNTVHLLAAEEAGGTFLSRALGLQGQLTEVLDHCLYSGHRVLREISRRHGGGSRALMPVLFNSLVELSHPAHQARSAPEGPPPAMAGGADVIPVEITANLPQVLFIGAVFEGAEGRLFSRFQIAEDFFPPGLTTAMREAFDGLVRRLAEDETAWDQERFPFAPAIDPARPLRVLDEAQAPRPDWVPGPVYARAEDGGLRRTGFVGRSLPGGEVERLAREEDFVAEVAGAMAELWRIEAALESHPDVRSAAVRSHTGPDGRSRLAAWVVPEPGAGVDAAALAAHLRRGFPAYLIPAWFEEIPEGVDRAALPPIGAEWRDSRERGLARLWAGILESPGPVGPEDDFFALGGDSFSAARMLAAARERFGRDADLASFFAQPTIRHLAALLGRGPQAAPPLPVAAPPVREVAPAPPRRDWLDRLFPDSLSRGMRSFLVLWLGQLVSAIGSGLGSFALGVWLFEQTRSATSFAMIGAVAGVLLITLSPVAGAVADRVDRRRLLLMSDLGSGLTTLAVAALLLTGLLRPWHVYPVVALMVTFIAFQGPALTASVSLLVPRSQLARASGMTQTGRSLAQIIGPLAAGALVGRIGYHGVILLDFATFLFAAGTLLLVRIPLPPRKEGPASGSLLANLTFGWTYLRRLPGLFGLLSLFAMTNFCMGMVQALLTPLILGFATPEELGRVSSAGAAGALLGGLTLAAWGGPRRRVPAILALLAAQALLLFLGGVQPSIPLIALASFAFMFTLPFANGFSQAILQSKVAPDVQGRVFAVAGMIAAASLPLASLIAGPLADRVFGPMLAPGGALAGTVGQLIGTGDGRGVGLLFIVLGAMVLILVSLASLHPRLRRLETEIPDALPGS